LGGLFSSGGKWWLALRWFWGKGYILKPLPTDFLQLEMTNLQISFTYKIYSTIKYLNRPQRTNQAICMKVSPDRPDFIPGHEFLPLTLGFA
jgi:hypothetical protein